jgi:hypothetical protein
MRAPLKWSGPGVAARVGCWSVATRLGDVVRPVRRCITLSTLSEHAEALDWAARIARSCRCAQEVREIMYDPGS